VGSRHLPLPKHGVAGRTKQVRQTSSSTCRSRGPDGANDLVRAALPGHTALVRRLVVLLEELRQLKELGELGELVELGQLTGTEEPGELRHKRIREPGELRQLQGTESTSRDKEVMRSRGISVLKVLLGSSLIPGLTDVTGSSSTSGSSGTCSSSSSVGSVSCLLRHVRSGGVCRTSQNLAAWVVHG